MKPQIITKICSTCKIEKKISEFYKDNASNSGRYYQCKNCTVLATRALRNKKKECIIIAF